MFFCLPIKVGQTRDKEIIPIVNIALIVINILPLILQKRLFGLNCETSPLLPYILVCFLYGFTYPSLLHFLLNIWILLVVGNAVNRRLGNLWYSIVYFGIAIIIGLLTRILGGPNLIGIPGAIYAILVIGLILMPAARIDILFVAFFPLTLLVGLFSRPKHWIYWFVRWGRFKIKALWCLLFVPVLEIFGLFAWGWNWVNLQHLLGLACGIGAVLILSKHISMKRESDPMQISYDFD